MGSRQCHGPQALRSSVRSSVVSKTENKSAMVFFFFGFVQTRSFFFFALPALNVYASFYIILLFLFFSFLKLSLCGCINALDVCVCV